MNNIPRVHLRKETSLGELMVLEKALFRLEQKSVERMMDIVSNCIMVGQIMLDTCTGTVAIAKTWSQLLANYRLVRCEKYSASFQDVFKLLRVVYARMFCVQTRT